MELETFKEIERIRARIRKMLPSKSEEELELIFAMTIKSDIEADRKHRITRHQVGRCWACGEEVYPKYYDFKLIGDIFWCGRPECAAEIADDFYPKERAEWKRMIREYYADDDSVTEETFPFSEYVIEEMLKIKTENYLGYERNKTGRC